MRKDVILTFLLILTVGFFFGSCATIFNGTKQTVAFNSYPQGAEVFVNGTSSNQITPCYIDIKRKVKESRYNKRNEYCYIFRKDGYKEVKVQDYRKIDLLTACDFFTPVFMGFIVDFATGAAYKYNKQIDAELSKDDVVKDRIPPVISIISPEVKRGFKNIVEENDIIIRLKVKDESNVSFVSVNNIKLVENQYGFYQLNLKLKKGLNTVNIKAIDSRDNVANEVFAVEFKDKVSNTDFIVPDNDELTNIGEYHALIIGIQDYDDPSINDLDNPITDAEKLYSVLSSKYNFKQE